MFPFRAGTDGRGWGVELRKVRYSGQGFSLRGEKDRFVLPADFRKAVKESGGGERTLCLQLHPEWPCLIGFGLSREAEFDAELDREADDARALGQPFNRQARASQLFGFTKIPFDDSGRLVMPPRFLKAANLADRLYFQGSGVDFTIWNPAELDKMGGEWRHAQIACADLEEDALAAKGRKS